MTSPEGYMYPRLPHPGHARFGYDLDPHNSMSRLLPVRSRLLAPPTSDVIGPGRSSVLVPPAGSYTQYYKRQVSDEMLRTSDAATGPLMRSFSAHSYSQHSISHGLYKCILRTFV